MPGARTVLETDFVAISIAFNCGLLNCMYCAVSHCKENFSYKGFGLLTRIGITKNERVQCIWYLAHSRDAHTVVECDINFWMSLTVPRIHSGAV